MKNKNFTLMIVPEAHAQVRRIQIPKRTLYLAGILALGLFGVLSSLVVHYAYIVGQVFEASSLRDENQRLQTRIVELATRVDDLDSRLAAVRVFEDKLRVMTDLRDDARGLAMGPLNSAAQPGEKVASDIDPFAVPVQGDDPAIAQLRDALLDSRMVGLAHEANRELSTLSELVDYFSVREVLLKSTPSIAPARGLLTSGFGARKDPFTGVFSMHSGLDIAGDEGAKIVAPGAGVVVFAGELAAYGNTIRVDHGRDIITLYGHLSRIFVKVGDKVERGQHIGNIGNTGRSTGAHLHYEVRKQNIPVNPRPYVLY